MIYFVLSRKPPDKFCVVKQLLSIGPKDKTNALTLRWRKILEVQVNLHGVLLIFFLPRSHSLFIFVPTWVMESGKSQASMQVRLKSLFFQKVSIDCNFWTSVRTKENRIFLQNNEKRIHTIYCRKKSHSSLYWVLWELEK